MAARLNTPTDGNFNVTQKHSIEGSIYYMNTYYNYRSGWYVSLYNSLKEPLLLGSKIMPYTELFVSLNIFEGRTICLDTTGIGDEVVGRDNFGSDRRYQLVYLSKTEYETFTGGSA